MTVAEIAALSTIGVAVLSVPPALWRWRSVLAKRKQEHEADVIAREDARRKQDAVYREVLGADDEPGLREQMGALTQRVDTIAHQTNGPLGERLTRIEGLANLVLATQQERAVEDGRWRGRMETRQEAVEARVVRVDERVSHLEGRVGPGPALPGSPPSGSG